MEVPIEKVKQICREYDEAYGSFPESQYEGKALWNYIATEVGVNGEEETKDEWEED